MPTPAAAPTPSCSTTALNNQTITLTSGVISVTDSLIIDGDLDGDDTPMSCSMAAASAAIVRLEFQTTTANGIS